MMKYPLSFDTSYHQFYIYDRGSQGNTNSSSFWTDETFNDRLAVEEGILGVGTECYGNVKAELQILEIDDNNEDLSCYDHIVEAGLEIKSGIIEVMDCPTSKVELAVVVSPGFYKVRIYSLNLSSVVDDNGDDFYLIKIWPELNLQKKVLKRYKS